MLLRMRRKDRLEMYFEGAQAGAYRRFQVERQRKGKGLRRVEIR